MPAPTLLADELLTRSRTVLAQLDGEIAVPGLQEPVEILRDRWGIAHIYAQNTHDLFLAQGYSMAQDRLFQVDLWRRIARGEAADLFGPAAVAADRFARLLRYRGDMAAEWSCYAPDARDIAVAFTDGINAYIDAVQQRLPIEFQLAGYGPEKWEPEDIVGRMSGIVMSGNWELEIARAQLIAALGIESARMLAPTDPPQDFAPPPGVDLHSLRREILSGIEAATRGLTYSASRSESNNWVVGGALSSSGKPMLASDPHRSTTLPSLRYLVHLNAPGWNVIGSGEPALPGVAIGHNERIAWGFTIICADQADLYIERTHPEDPRQYRVGDRWEAMEIGHESIRVRGELDSRSHELRFTRHGPVIYQDENRQIAVALKWAGSEPGGAAYLASLSVDRAQHRGEFLQALARWKIPGLNFVYADIDGEFGWIGAGAIPVRKQGNGLLPSPGETGEYDWERNLTVAELPQTFNPACGWVASANHNIVPPGYSPFISADWFAPYRYQRIASQLEGRRALTLADFRRLQHDTVSLPAQHLQAVVRSAAFPAEFQVWVQMFLTWDCDLSAASEIGALFSVWSQELLSAMYDLHPGFPPPTDRTDLRSLPVILEQLSNPTPDWFGANPISRRNSVLRDTLKAAILRLNTLLGDGPALWSWGKVHLVTFHHPLAGLGTEFAKAFSLGPLPRGGDDHTPMNTKYDQNFQQVHGATFRQVLDLADWDRGLATSAPGQSGQPGSPHYADLLPMWAKGEYFPLAFSRQKVEDVTQHRLMLMPPT
ncbi:MAG: penicillin acylase family protein [Planctomycetaceae bacterium]|nr:penicillin acylase family protein [Planctomycetaceae bacterium]